MSVTGASAAVGPADVLALGAFVTDPLAVAAG